ncbi:MAG TPA: hypothetical protein P5295_01190 [Spirochaetota bacterium]|nr:hypothetical protein [Spirochaetota bacterium]
MQKCGGRGGKDNRFSRNGAKNAKEGDAGGEINEIKMDPRFHGDDRSPIVISLSQ